MGSTQAIRAALVGLFAIGEFGVKFARAVALGGFFAGARAHFKRYGDFAVLAFEGDAFGVDFAAVCFDAAQGLVYAGGFGHVKIQRAVTDLGLPGGRKTIRLEVLGRSIGLLLRS